LIEQMDLFEGKLFPEFIQAEKIRVLEQQQDTLRRGLFKRLKEQEKKNPEPFRISGKTVLKRESNFRSRSRKSRSSENPCWIDNRKGSGNKGASRKKLNE
jgi:hypothetical protein